MEEKYLLHDASKEMPHADKNTDILFHTKDGKWLQGYCHKGVLITASAFYEQSQVEEWCYLKDVSSL